MSRKFYLKVTLTALVVGAMLAWGPNPREAAAQEATSALEEHDGDEHDGHADEEGHAEDSDEHDDHADKEGRGGHAEDSQEDHEEEQVVRLDEATRQEFGVEVATANSGHLEVHVSLTGEIVIDPDRLVHVAPRVSGIVRHVDKRLGDEVRAGDVMAVIDSRELSELKSAYLVARERMALAASSFEREEKLWKQEVSSEREYLEATQTLAETRIEMRAAEQELHALGFSESYLHQLRFEDDSFTRYEIIAPFDGTVIEKHVTLGEFLQSDTGAFAVADLSSVWANLTLYQNDLSSVFEGQSAHVSAGKSMAPASGQVAYVSPIIDEETRTATVRVVLDNPDGRWRPGTFVSGKIDVGEIEVDIIVPKSSLQTMDSQTVVFVEADEGFEPRPVTLGRTNDTSVEVIAGLNRGQRYVTHGSFTLKAQLAKGAFGDGHNH